MTIDSQILDEVLMASDVEARLRASWDQIALDVPELGALAMAGDSRDGKKLHKDNVEHTILVTAKSAARQRVRLAALFHDVGKPPTRVIHDDGTVTFHGHEALGGKITEEVLERLGYDEQLAREVASIVRLSGATKGSVEWTDSSVRRFANEAGDLLEDLLDFANVDVTSRHEYKHEEVRDEITTLRARIIAVRESDEAAKWRPVLSGDDIMARYGLTPGREVGMLLKTLSARQREIEADAKTMSEEAAWELLDGVRGEAQ
jgi:poly(A) polymerase